MRIRKILHETEKKRRHTLANKHEYTLARSHTHTHTTARKHSELKVQQYDTARATDICIYNFFKVSVYFILCVFLRFFFFFVIFLLLFSITEFIFVSFFQRQPIRIQMCIRVPNCYARIFFYHSLFRHHLHQHHRYHHHRIIVMWRMQYRKYLSFFSLSLSPSLLTFIVIIIYLILSVFRCNLLSTKTNSIANQK